VRGDGADAGLGVLRITDHDRTRANAVRSPSPGGLGLLAMLGVAEVARAQSGDVAVVTAANQSQECLLRF
jgi:hypothetical protein